MKCQSCGWNYYFKTHCPRCGANGYEPRNGFGRFLATTISIGNFKFNVLYLYFLIAFNLSLLSLVVNLIIYNACNAWGGVWTHYVVLVTFALFIIFRGFFIQRSMVLASVRHMIYLLLAFFGTVQVLATGNYVFLSYVVPSLCVFLSLFSFVALSAKWSSQGSFYFTLVVAAVLSVTPFVLTFILPLSTAGSIYNYIAFSITMIAFSNAFILKGLALLFRARESIRKRQ